MKEIQLSQITERIQVRAVKPNGVELLKKKIEEVGYLPEHPLLVTPNGSGFILIEGNHRYEALTELGYDKPIPVVIDETLTTPALRLRRARQANEATETLIPTTFVDDAELVWQLSGEKIIQAEIANILGLGWTREKVAHYNRLDQIDKKAWGVIVTTVDRMVTESDDSMVTLPVTTVTFSERLLREVIPLTPAQQLELVSDLAAEKIKKEQFNKRAAAYKIRNAIREYVISKLPEVTPEFLESRITDIDRGGYDADWETKDKPKITKLIESILAEWEQKSGTKLILGDFDIEILGIEDGLIDLVLTDIPYNISDQGKVTKQGSEIVNASFGDGEWDVMPSAEYLETLKGWVKQWARVLRAGGAAISFCDKVLVSDLWRFFIDAGLTPKGVIVWEKDNPNPSGLSRRNMISSVEFMVWGIKPGASYTFNESETWNRSNVINAPLCAGNERLKDEKGNTLHPTQKPLKVLTPLIEVFSNRGEIVLDGFVGVGSTGEAATTLGRKFIGIEIDEKYYRVIGERLK